jgi:ParB-like chromosome segregation protein Spo0J
MEVYADALAVVYQETQHLIPHARNARTHSKRQIRQIADSIGVFGFTNPILIDRAATIVAGHGRVEAAKLLGLETVPTICLENLNQDQIRAYILADNKLGGESGLGQRDSGHRVTAPNFHRSRLRRLADGI